MRFAVVDIETTGSYAARHRITEIGICIVEDGSITRTFQSLVNPDRSIPSYITSLTGINDDMVSDAPGFEEIADEILELTEGCVFVAHNVNFDYSFLRSEFELLGQTFKRKKLCTVRATKAIYPGWKSYSLARICEQLHINNKAPHRAWGDAEATALLLIQLFGENQEKIHAMLKRESRTAILPPHLPQSSFDNLPEKTGVYYFHDRNGKVIYVGKAKNIKKRIVSHFSGKNNSLQRRSMINEIHDISFEICGNELVAYLLESSEIKRYFPKYNQAQKFAGRQFGLYRYKDHNGYERFSISKWQAHLEALATFRSLHEARTFLMQQTKAHELCPKLCGLQQTPQSCYEVSSGNCRGACKGKESPDLYNKRVKACIESFLEQKETFVIYGSGRTFRETAVVYIEEGVYQGYGYISGDEHIERIDQLKDHIDLKPSNQDTQKIIASYLRNHGEKKVKYFS